MPGVSALLMLAEKVQDLQALLPWGADMAYDSKNFVRTGARIDCDPASYKEWQVPQQQPEPENDAAAWIRDQPEPPLAGGEGLWVAKKTGPLRQVGRAGERGLAIRLQQ
jgi:hypothetical protein